MFWKDKKVLVTGSTGFCGGWLSLELHRLGAKVYGYGMYPVGNWNETVFSTFPADMINNHHICCSEHGITSSTLYDKFKDIDIVFHLAAQPLVRQSYKNPARTFETNIMGTVNLLEYIKNSKTVKALNVITTDKVYKNKESEIGYTEEDVLGGHDPYSCSKVCVEHIVKCYNDSYLTGHGVGVVTSRAGNIIGGGDWSEDRIIPDCVRQTINKAPIVIRNPKAIRPWQYILDAVNGYLLAAEHAYTYRLFNSFNFGPDPVDFMSVEDLVKLFCKHWGDGASYIVEQQCTNMSETQTLVLDSSHAKNELRWGIKYPVDVAMYLLVRYYKNLTNSSRSPLTSGRG